MRIVTLLPSATEIVCLLGLQDQLVGISHECDFPLELKSLPRVTSALISADATSREIDELVRQQLSDRQPLYSLDVDLLAELKPDLIITQNLCSVCAVSATDLNRVTQQLSGSPRILTLEPTTLAGVLQSIRAVAVATDTQNIAEIEIGYLQKRINAVVDQVSKNSIRPTSVFLEWFDPPFSAGHWIPELIDLAGAQELIGQAGEPSRTIAWQDVANADPDVLILACCGYSSERTREDTKGLDSLPVWRDLRAVRAGKVFVLDGNSYFSRPGPRLVDGLELLTNALHGKP